MKGDGLSLRSSVEADVPQLHAILSEPRNVHILKNDSVDLRAGIAAAATEPQLDRTMRFTAVDDDGTIVGSATLDFKKRSFSLDAPDLGDEVLTVEPTLAVKFDRQRRGVGRRMFIALLPIIIEHGDEFPLVFARTQQGNTSAEALLRTLRFREIGSEQDVGANRSPTAGFARRGATWNRWARWVHEFAHEADDGLIA
jgi:GNAT superfamily N-acetyltransferase